jgi:hypothetical protein
MAELARDHGKFLRVRLSKSLRSMFKTLELEGLEEIEEVGEAPGEPKSRGRASREPKSGLRRAATGAADARPARRPSGQWKPAASSGGGGGTKPGTGAWKPPEAETPAAHAGDVRPPRQPSRRWKPPGEDKAARPKTVRQVRPEEPPPENRR